MTATPCPSSTASSRRAGAGAPAAPAPARHRRRRGRPAAARPHGRARRGAAVAARQGAGERHAALLPPARRGRVRRGRRARAARDELADFIAEARERLRPRGARSRSASRTAPTSPPPCCCCGPRRSPARVLLRAMVPLRDPPSRRPRRQAGADPLRRRRPDRAARERGAPRGDAGARRRPGRHPRAARRAPALAGGRDAGAAMAAGERSCPGGDLVSAGMRCAPEYGSTAELRGTRDMQRPWGCSPGGTGRTRHSRVV